MDQPPNKRAGPRKTVVTKSRKLQELVLCAFQHLKRKVAVYEMPLYAILFCRSCTSCMWCERMFTMSKTPILFSILLKRRWHETGKRPRRQRANVDATQYGCSETAFGTMQIVYISLGRAFGLRNERAGEFTTTVKMVTFSPTLAGVSVSLCAQRSDRF